MRRLRIESVIEIDAAVGTTYASYLEDQVGFARADTKNRPWLYSGLSVDCSTRLDDLEMYLDRTIGEYNIRCVTQK